MKELECGQKGGKVGGRTVRWITDYIATIGPKVTAEAEFRSVMLVSWHQVRQNL